MRPSLALLASTTSLLLASAPHAQTPAQAPPKLAVIIVVDQMRADYVDRFKDDWSKGLARLVNQGAWFRRAAYPYLNTFTCAGHATVGTGAFPYTHGVFQNTYFSRESDRVIPCTEDPSVTPVSYGRRASGNDGPAQLGVPTFADEMRQQRQSRVVSLSLKARSAIMLAGHGGDAVTWLSDSLDSWETSTAYASAPVPAVAEYVRANPIEADFGKVWAPQLAPGRAKERDDAPGEDPPAGWTNTFPHPLQGMAGNTTPSAEYYAQWERSPYADAYLGRMAAALVQSMQLGQRDTTDVLAVSFSTPDLLGHVFGPRSLEVRELYYSLDETIGALLDALDATVGRDQYVLALTADHGVTPIPEQLIAQGRDAGRLDAQRILTAVEIEAREQLKGGQAVARMVGNDIYFLPGALEQLAAIPGALEALTKAARGQPGVAGAFHAMQLADGASSKDAKVREAALGWAKGRSGDMVIAPKPGWMSGTSGTTHGSANDDDQRVPILLFGAGIKPGRFDAAASPADIAPTLAAITGISLPRAQGTMLRPAMTNGGATSANAATGASPDAATRR